MKLKDKARIEWLGREFYNNHGERAVVINYVTNNEIYIQFDYGDIRKITASHLKRGDFTSKYSKTVLNRGYLGEGNYECSVKVGNKYIVTEQYNHWQHMIKRVYSQKALEKMPTYADCEVCEEWFNYQNFAEWYDNNKWFEGQQFLDKDILYKGNKIYSPENCVLVNNELNLLFLKSQSARGDLPIGVIWQKNNHNYVARCSVEGKGMKHIGVFNSPDDAFYAYKEFKEKHIKEVADKYKRDYPKFPQKLYEAMYNYRVEITD